MLFRPVLALIAGLCFAGLSATWYPVHADSSNPVERIFTKIERELIERYFERQGALESGEKSHKGKGHKGKKGKGAGKGRKGLPPGLAKRDSLPPGLAKRETLPPGLAKRSLPQDLDEQLPPLEEVVERAIVDKSVVLIERATGRVLDILTNVVP